MAEEYFEDGEGEEDEVSPDIPRNTKDLRACLRCSLIKSYSSVRPSLLSLFFSFSLFVFSVIWCFHPLYSSKNMAVKIVFTWRCKAILRKSIHAQLHILMVWLRSSNRARAGQRDGSISKITIPECMQLKSVGSCLRSSRTSWRRTESKISLNYNEKATSSSRSRSVYDIYYSW